MPATGQFFAARRISISRGTCERAWAAVSCTKDRLPRRAPMHHWERFGSPETPARITTTQHYYQSSTSGPTPSALRRRMSSNNTPSGSATNAYS